MLELPDVLPLAEPAVPAVEPLAVEPELVVPEPAELVDPGEPEPDPIDAFVKMNDAPEPDPEPLLDVADPDAVEPLVDPVVPVAPPMSPRCRQPTTVIVPL